MASEIDPQEWAAFTRLLEEHRARAAQRRAEINFALPSFPAIVPGTQHRKPNYRQKGGTPERIIPRKAHHKR